MTVASTVRKSTAVDVPQRADQRVPVTAREVALLQLRLVQREGALRSTHPWVSKGGVIVDPPAANSCNHPTVRAPPRSHTASYIAHLYVCVCVCVCACVAATASARGTRMLAPICGMGDSDMFESGAQHLDFGHRVAVRPALRCWAAVRRDGELEGRRALDAEYGRHVPAHHI